MSKKYDLINRLKSANEKPFITIAEGMSYEINNSKTTAIHLQALSEDDTLKDFDKMDKMFEITLGKKAAKEINEKDFSTEALGIILEAIMAGMAGEELKEVEKRFPEQAEAK